MITAKYYGFVLVIFLLTYFLAPFLFFQQDEWLNFGLIQGYGTDLILHRFSSEDINHLVPVNRVINHLLFEISGLNVAPYHLFGLTVHFVNGLLIINIIRNLTQNRFISLAGGILFITSAKAAELVLWPAVNVSLLSLTFSLLAWKCAMQAFEQKSSYLIGLGVSILVLLALMTIEYSFFMTVFIPFLLLLAYKYKKVTWRQLILILIPFVIMVLGYMAFRFYPALNQSSNMMDGSSSAIATRTLLLPFKYLGQLLVPVELTETLQRTFETHLSGLEIIICGIGGIFFLLINKVIAVLQRARMHQETFRIMVLTLFLLTSILPYFMVPNISEIQFLPRRYFYFGLAAKSLLISYLLYLSWQSKRLVLKRILIGVVIFYLIIGIGSNWKKELTLFHQGRERQAILSEIKKHYPVLPSRAIFYITSDSSYYGLPENVHVLPFQSGVGQTLLVWYSPTEHFPKELFSNRFLWEITEQGYRENQGRGFGYYRDYQLLKGALRSNNLPIESVIAFKWDSKSELLVNTTAQVRQNLAKDLYEENK